MYAQSFGLTHEPFSIAPDPRYLFMSERHREALAHLLYGLGGGGGFVLLTGEIGTGKTTVCRCFLEQVPAGCHVAYIFNPRLTVHELLQSVCDEFGVPHAHAGDGTETARDCIDPLNAFLLRTHAAGESAVLVIDEAQNLSADVLEQLRLLTNLETSERKLLQIVLIGQPELRGLLARPELEQLAQRVIARYHLDALTEAETAQYIGHRLAVAGHTGPLPFDRGALQRIHRITRGVPRRINLLCGRALLGAYATNRHVVDKRIVDKAAREVFGAGGTEPAANGGYAPRRGPLLVGGGALAGAALVAAIAWAVGRGDVAPSASATAAAVAPASATATGRMPGGSSAAANGTNVGGVGRPGTTGAPASSANSAAPAANAATGRSPADAGLAQGAAAAATTPFDAAGAFAALSRNEDDAWRALAPTWGVPTGDPALAAGADPCRMLPRLGLPCFRSSRTSLGLLRQLDRPGILTLFDAQQKPAYALLVGLDASTATFGVGGQNRSVPLTALASLWRGDFATLWRTAPTQSGRVADPMAGTPDDWLAAQLARLDPATPAPTGAAVPALKTRIYRFQLAQGLVPDGRVGPITLMQLNRATGVDEPRLLPARNGAPAAR